MKGDPLMRSSSIRRRTTITAAVAFFAVVAVTMLGTTASAQSDAPKKLTFVIGYTQPPNTMNPLKAILTQEYEELQLEYPLLFGFDRDTLVATADPLGGGLASELPTTENGGISSDGLTYTIKIRGDRQWSDGEPITANDVAFTYNLILDQGFSNFANYLPYTDSITASDDTTLVWKTTKPTVAPFIPPYIFILPEHVWSKLGDKAAIRAFENYPDAVVAGPFNVTDWQKGESVTLERLPGTYPGLGSIDRVIYKFFSNTETMVQALKQGSIDFAEQIPASLFDTLQNEPDITTVSASGRTYSELAFNLCFTQAYCSKSGSESTGDPVLADINVRKAVAMAINKDQIVERVLRGYGTAGATPISASQAFWYWDPGDATVQWDIDGANALLDQSGYKDTDGDGIRNAPTDGHNLDWTFIVPSDNEDRIKAAELISGWLKQIGIKANPQTVTTAKMNDVWLSNDYDIYSWGWGPDPDPDFILSTYTSNQCGVWSDNCWSDAEYDKLYKEQQSPDSLEQRQQIIQQMQQVWYQEIPEVVLWNDNDLQAYRSDRWTGFVQQPAAEQGREGAVLYQYGLYSYLSIKPKSASAGTQSGSGGVSAIVWIAILVAAIVIIGGVMFMRRRTNDEDLA
jgi:peptide/nickel transport system substrate-binding protein